MNADQQRLAERPLKEGKSVREVACTFSVHPATLYRTAVAAQPASGLRDHPPCGQTREALGALRPVDHVQADWPPRSPRPSPGEPVPGIRLSRRDPPPSGRPARLHRLVCWWGGPVKRSGAMTGNAPWRCPPLMRRQFLCPRWTQPSALRPWCPAASPARRRRARRGAAARTTRVDGCRPAVTVSTIVVRTPRRRPPPRGRPHLPRSAHACRVHNIWGRRGAGCRLASDVLESGKPAAGAARAETPASREAVSNTVPP